MKLVFATHNQSKLKEVQQLLQDLPFEIISLNDLNYHDDIPETGDTLEENAWIKAKTIFDEFGLPVFSEDTGLIVDALGGAPGVRTARYAGDNANIADNIDLLLKNLRGKSNRTARFKTDICFITDKMIKHIPGICEGQIALEETGNDGFGYDPVFIPNGFNKSFAELGSDIKNTISHRKKAISGLIAFLSKL